MIGIAALVASDTAREIGERIRAFRKERGLLVGELAQRVDLSSPSMSKIEGGTQEPSAHQVMVIARALNVRVSELYGEPARVDAIAEVVAATMAGGADTVRERLALALAALTGSGSEG